MISGWPWHQALRLLMGGLALLMISNVPYPVIPQVGFRSARGLIALGILVIGVAMLVFGRLEYFFPLFVIYVSWGLVRGFAIGIYERRQQGPASGWFPGGQRASEAARLAEPPSVETVGDDGTEEEPGPGGGHRRRRRRRRRSGGHNPDFDRNPPPSDREQ